jgi:hypothetical protein
MRSTRFWRRPTSKRAWRTRTDRSLVSRSKIGSSRPRRHEVPARCLRLVARTECLSFSPRGDTTCCRPWRSIRRPAMSGSWPWRKKRGGRTSWILVGAGPPLLASAFCPDAKGPATAGQPSVGQDFRARPRFLGGGPVQRPSACRGILQQRVAPTPPTTKKPFAGRFGPAKGLKKDSLGCTPGGQGCGTLRGLP